MDNEFKDISRTMLIVWVSFLLVIAGTVGGMIWLIVWIVNKFA